MPLEQVQPISNEWEKFYTFLSNEFKQEVHTILTEVDQDIDINVPEKVLDYLREKNRTILNDYKDPSGQFIEHCLLIATDLAKIFVEAWKRPYLIKVNEKIVIDGFRRSKMLKPLVYDWRVEWWGHIVCCYWDYVYDPVIWKPVNINNYTQEIFWETIKMKTLIDECDMWEFLSR